MLVTAFLIYKFMLSQLDSMKASFYPYSLMCVLLKGSNFTYKVRMIWTRIWWVILLHLLCLIFFNVRQSAWFWPVLFVLNGLESWLPLNLIFRSAKCFFCPRTPAAAVHLWFRHKWYISEKNDEIMKLLCIEII